MKKILTFVALFGFLLSANAFAQDQMINPDQLPKQITQYVQDHFPDSKIVSAQKENEIFSPVQYEVWLDNGTQVEFEETTMVNIEGNSKLPESVVPDKLSAYVQTNYSDASIVSVDFDDNRQGVELSNGLELVFDNQGNFIGMDD